MAYSPSFPKTFLYTALPCEAKPVIDAYKLKKDNDFQMFNIFHNDEIFLTVTGIGKVAMAAGVAYSQALFQGNLHPIMLNIGIAGHQYHAIGSLFLADKITDNETSKSFYPPFVSKPPCPTAEVITFSKPQNTYPKSALCDMEASSFYETATRFSTGELCQCAKIISDNSHFPTTTINAKYVSELVQSNLPSIKHIISALNGLANSLPKLNSNSILDDICGQFHFTMTERHQLQKSLNRWQLVGQGIDLHELIESASTGKEFTQQLNQALNETEFWL